jgi:alkanesulfonate monooxygenase SsuD/methylene tetrahydromethanopterin reductase-like flavin-dependent oxidoreductase (luciferase family)
MDFSAMVLTMYVAHEDGPETDEDVLSIAVEQSLASAALGFNPWFTEHHFRGPWHSNPIQFASYIAPQIPAERYLGFGVLSTPYYNPVRLVESMNLLDQLTRGRTLYGLGSGFPGLEPAGMGLGTEYHGSGRAAQDTLDVMQKLWAFRTGDPEYVFKTETHQGSIRRRVTPAPYRKHHPTVIRTASRDASLVAAAKNGWPVFLGATGATATPAEQWRTYLDALAKETHAPDVIAECLRWSTVDWLSVVIADTDAEAQKRLDLARAERTQMRKRYADQHGPLHGPLSRARTGQSNAAAFAAGGDMMDSIVGNPETVARKVQELVDLGINHLLLRFVGEWTGETRWISETSMNLFAQEIAPKFRDVVPHRDLGAFAVLAAGRV